MSTLDLGNFYSTPPHFASGIFLPGASAFIYCTSTPTPHTFFFFFFLIMSPEFPLHPQKKHLGPRYILFQYKDWRVPFKNNVRSSLLLNVCTSQANEDFILCRHHSEKRPCHWEKKKGAGRSKHAENQSITDFSINGCKDEQERTNHSSRCFFFVYPRWISSGLLERLSL